MTDTITYLAAACRDVDPGIFQADEPAYAPEYALSICKQCPQEVKAECLEMFMKFEGGMSGKHRTGIAGGMTPGQRAALARKTGGWGSERTQSLAYTLWEDGLSDRAIADTAGIKVESVRKFRSSRGLLANPPNGTNQPEGEG